MDMKEDILNIISIVKSSEIERSYINDENLYLDSIQVVRMVVLIEEKFDIEFDLIDLDITKLTNLNYLIETIEELIQNKNVDPS